MILVTKLPLVVPKIPISTGITEASKIANTIKPIINNDNNNLKLKTWLVWMILSGAVNALLKKPLLSFVTCLACWPIWLCCWSWLCWFWGISRCWGLWWYVERFDCWVSLCDCLDCNVESATSFSFDLVSSWDVESTFWWVAALFSLLFDVMFCSSSFFSAFVISLSAFLTDCGCRLILCPHSPQNKSSSSIDYRNSDNAYKTLL